MLRLLPLVLLLALAGCRTEPATPEASGEEAAESPAASGAPAEPDTSEAAPEAAARLVPLGADGTPDLDAYPLTMEKLTRWANATARLSALTESDPALAAKWQSDGVDPNSYEAMLVRIGSEPRAVAAVREAKMSPEEYIATGVVYLRSASASLDPGAGLDDLPGVTDANVGFVTDNRLKIDSMLVTTLGR